MAFEENKQKYLVIASIFVFVLIIFSVVNIGMSGNVTNEAGSETGGGYTLGVVLAIVFGVILFLAAIAWFLHKIHE